MRKFERQSGRNAVREFGMNGKRTEPDAVDEHYGIISIYITGIGERHGGGRD